MSVVRSLASDWLRLLSGSTYNPSTLMFLSTGILQNDDCRLLLGVCSRLLLIGFFHFFGRHLFHVLIGFRGSFFVLLIVGICSLPLEKGRWNGPKYANLCGKSLLTSHLSHPGSNPSTHYSRSGTKTAANDASSQGGPSAYPSVVVPYNAQHRRVPVTHPGLSPYAIWSLPAVYSGSSVSDPAQAGGYTAGSVHTGVPVHSAGGN